MRVRIGERAPELEVEAYVPGAEDVQHVSLGDHRGRWVVLFFYPRDFTFVCPTEIQGFAQLESAFEREDAVVLGASTDSFWTHKAWYGSDPRLASVRFPILADTSHRLADAFGVLLPDGTALRATFLVDPEGIIRHASITDLSVGRSVVETLRVLQALRTGELCPLDWQPGQPTLRAVS